MISDSFRTREQAIDDNFLAFQTKLPEILIAYGGKAALLRNREIDGFFDTSSEAIREGKRRYPDKMFSVQTVEPMQPANLGWFSHFSH